MKTALIIDCEGYLSYVRHLFEPLGWAVRFAASDWEALLNGDEARPEFVLIDFADPLLDSETVRQIRRTKWGTVAFLVGITDCEAVHRTEALAAGCDAHLSRPVSFISLMGLTKHVEAERMRATRAA